VMLALLLALAVSVRAADKPKCGGYMAALARNRESPTGVTFQHFRPFDSPILDFGDLNVGDVSSDRHWTAYNNNVQTLFYMNARSKTVYSIGMWSSEVAPAAVVPDGFLGDVVNIATADDSLFVITTNALYRVDGLDGMTAPEELRRVLSLNVTHQASISAGDGAIFILEGRHLYTIDITTLAITSKWLDFASFRAPSVVYSDIGLLTLSHNRTFVDVAVWNDGVPTLLVSMPLSEDRNSPLYVTAFASTLGFAHRDGTKIYFFDLDYLEVEDPLSFDCGSTLGGFTE